MPAARPGSPHPQTRAKKQVLHSGLVDSASGIPFLEYGDYGGKALRGQEQRGTGARTCLHWHYGSARALPTFPSLYFLFPTLIPIKSPLVTCLTCKTFFRLAVFRVGFSLPAHHSAGKSACPHRHVAEHLE